MAGLIASVEGRVLYLQISGQVGAGHDARHGREEHAEALHETGGGRRMCDIIRVAKPDSLILIFEAAPPLNLAQNRIFQRISVAGRPVKCTPGVLSDGGRLVEWVKVFLGGVEAPAGVAERVSLILVDLGNKDSTSKVA